MSSSSSPPRNNGRISPTTYLNPYASMARSAFPKEPESPSTMLLRELQGPDEDDEPSNSARSISPRYREDHGGRLSRSSAGRTPTKRSFATGADSNEDDDGPSQSLMFGNARPESGGDRTPRSPPTPLPDHHRPMVVPAGTAVPRPRDHSPGPFQPPSSSASGRSGSTSPGPSVYTSGIEAADIGSSSVSPSISAGPSRNQSSSTSPTRDKRATFREPPITRPAAPVRAVSGSSGKKASPRAGYLDPPVPEPRKSKGKEKAKNQGGRRYVAIAASAEEDEVDQLEEEGRPERKVGLSAYERALWRWVNVEDLDGYLQEVYAYYKGKGFFCIILARFLNLVTTFFVIGFSTFLFSCIDYSKLDSELSGPNSIGRLDDVLIKQCLTRGSFPHMFFIISVGVVYLFQLASFIMSIPRLMDMYRFYTHLLGIPDADIQTLPWPEIVRLVGEIRKHNPVTSLSNGQADALAELVGDGENHVAIKKLDAHDVANRILRQENYLIALFNKDLLDLRVRFPLPHSVVPYVPPRFLAPALSETLPSTRADKRERRFVSFGKNTLTKALEWNLRFCLMGYLFDGRGQVRKEFVREKRRKDLVEELKRRFIFMAVLNAILSPFIVIYLLIYFFFRYFDEFHKNPSSIGSRQYTPYAQWKFREFNELPHLFEQRLDRSYPIAKEYIDQFPKERTALIMRFVAFIAGSFAAVLLVASLIDPDLFLHFEISPHRTVLFYLGLFGGVLAVARGMIPEENLVFDPEASLREVVKWTHYLPGEWQGKMHSQMVHQEFGTLFSMKIGIFFQELLSVLLTPFILFFSLPPCAGAIIDFFRDFTVHVEGVGYVCSFAVFDFRRHGIGNPSAQHDTDPNSQRGTTGKSPLDPDPTSSANPRTVAGRDRREWNRANENKMEKSFLHFKATHPDWVPDPSSSMFLDKLVGVHQRMNPQLSPVSAGPGHAGYGGGMGGRGLGLGGSAIDASGDRHWGMDEGRIQERSRTYDRAWAKSSHLLASSSASGHGLGSGIAGGNHGRSHLSVGLEGGGGGGGRVRGASRERREGLGLETMDEQEERENDEAEERRWGAGTDAGPGGRLRDSEEDWEEGGGQVKGRGYEDEEEDREERGFLKDVGVVGILQQIMGR